MKCYIACLIHPKNIHFVEKIVCYTSNISTNSILSENERGSKSVCVREKETWRQRTRESLSIYVISYLNHES